MYIRQTKTRVKAGEAYYTYRLVESVREGNKVRQQTLLNLGSNFNLHRDLWVDLCNRIKQIVSGQNSLFECSDEIEKLAYDYATQLIAKKPHHHTTEPDFHEVNVETLEMHRPRTIGVENIAINALNQLGFDEILQDCGFNHKQIALSAGLIAGRMAEPGSELHTWRWLTTKSGLGELLDFDFTKSSHAALYRTADLLLKHKDIIEEKLFGNITDLFSLAPTITLYDITNTYFEGEMALNPKAKKGHSKEKRTDCPLVSVGIVLDESGFIRRSQIFSGNVSEPVTVEQMLTRINAPKGAIVVMDRGFTTKDNIKWLCENKFRYIVISRQQTRKFDKTNAISIKTASKQEVFIQREINEDNTEAFLYCYSPGRKAKEEAILKRFMERFENELFSIKKSLSKPRGTKHYDKILQKIGRLKQSSRGISKYYQIDIKTDESNKKVTDIIWEQKKIQGSMLSNPGVYCIRTNELNLDKEKLWQTYIMLTDLEAVFRSLKSELGLRPIYHKKEDRTDSHIFISILAYQAVQIIRNKLKKQEIQDSWQTIRETLSTQCRITATFQTKDNKTLHIRKATKAEPETVKIYNALGVSHTPGSVHKVII